MKRRAFIAGLGGAAAWPILARGQRTIPLIGFLNTQSPDGFARYVAAFRQGLKDAGFVEGENVAIEYRWGEGRYDRLPRLVTELLDAHPALIVATGGVPAAAAAKAATTTVPVVFEVGIDPVASGLVTSINRPGGNLTGVVHTLNSLGPKLLELLRELVGGVAVIAVLVNPRFPPNAQYVSDLQKAANVVRQRLQIINASDVTEIDAAFAAIRQQHLGALIVASEPFFVSQREQVVALASSNVIPTIYPSRLFVEAGGLISYATDIGNVFRETGRYAARVLKGDQPADLPIQQAVKIELVLNLKTAKALNLDIPPQLLARADEVIE